MLAKYENAGFVYVRDSDDQILDEIDHIMIPTKRPMAVAEGGQTHSLYSVRS